jgi:hypothetical protein
LPTRFETKSVHAGVTVGSHGSRWSKSSVADQVGDLFAGEEPERRPPVAECSTLVAEVDLGGRAGEARVAGHRCRLRPNALRQARERAEATRVELRLIQGDMTKLGVDIVEGEVAPDVAVREREQGAITKPVEGCRRN